MRKALTAVPIAVGVFVLLSFVQAHAADSRLPITKKPDAASPHTISPPAATVSQPANPQTGVNTGNPPKFSALSFTECRFYGCDVVVAGACNPDNYTNGKGAKCVCRTPSGTWDRCIDEAY